MTTVLASLGTDRHRFDRLLRWLEHWYRSAPQPPRLVVQHGFTPPPRLPGAVEFLDHAALQDALAAATLVVSHGGPATITEARRAGHVPIVVPRDPERGEHVDDHQLRFTRRLHQDGTALRCDSEPDFHAALRRGLAAPARVGRESDQAGTQVRAEAAARVGRIVEELVARTGPRRPPRRTGGPRS